MWNKNSEFKAKTARLKCISALTLTVFVGGLFAPLGQGAWALDNGTSSAGSIQTSALQADYGGCDTVCKDVMSSMSAVSGEDKDAKQWNTGDAPVPLPFETAAHQLCGKLCAATDSASSPNGPRCFEEPTFTKGCSLPDQVLDQAGISSCEDANKKVKGCKFYNSTVATQCGVVQKATASNGYQETLLILDGVAAGLCATACWAEKTGVGATMYTVCKGASTAASAAELVGSIFVAGGGASSGHGAGSGAGFDIAAGIGGAAGGLATGVGSAVWGQKGWNAAAENSDNLKTFGEVRNAQGKIETAGKDLRGYTKNDAGQWVGPDGKPASESETAALNNDEAINKEEQKESCMAMVISLALGGIRLWSMLDANSTRKEACEQAESLYSQSLAAAAAAGGDAVINPNNSVVVNSSDGSLTGTTASGAAMTVTEGVGGDKSTPSVNDIISGEGFAATAEGQIMGPSGLAKAVAPLANQVDKNAFRKAISAGPAGFTQAALGGVGLTSDQAAAANAIVKNAYDNAPKLASRIGGSLYASGGGGGGRSGGGSSSSGGGNPFASLMGGKGAGQGTDAMSFGAVQRDPAGRIISSDIWHTGTDKNLFQIVSERVRVVEPRLK